MKIFCRFVLVCCLHFSSVSCFFRFPKEANTHSYSDGGKPANSLILTTLINEGKTEEARRAAEVKLKNYEDVKSYAGYLTVNEDYDSNLFFWFFPTKADYKNAPVVLWLQGGPGSSSMYGLFHENGPFSLTPNGNLTLREHSWTNNHSVIYIDNPVGTGFSFTDDGGFAENQTAVAAGLYVALLQFFELFPELQDNSFYVAGESYGGKYVPAISYAIHKNNPFAKQKINLQGLAVGNGWSDPEHQLLGYADYLYQIGLIDSHEKAKIEKAQEETSIYIRKKKWTEASNRWDKGILGYFEEVSGFKNLYNYLEPSNIPSSKQDRALNDYLQREDVRTALHVGNASFSSINWDVYRHLNKDIMRSVKHWISELLDHYRIVFYNGMLDIIVAYPLTVNFLQHLKFSAADEYKTAARHIWRVDSDIAGYVKQAGNLTEILVRNAGHMVPGDQPLWGSDLITRFTHNIPFY